MALKLKNLIQIIGDLATELQDSMAEGVHARFLSLWEDPDGDGTYTLKKDRLQLAQQMGFDVPKMVRRHLTSVIARELEFELETPLHLTGDAETSDDIEVSLKAGGLFKSHSFLKIKVKMEAVEPPEGLMVLVDKINAELKHDLGTPKEPSNNEGENNG